MRRSTCHAISTSPSNSCPTIPTCREARGEGWELATDAWGVARAGRGMLITTEARANAAGAAKDMTETTARLDAAREAQADLAGMA